MANHTSPAPKWLTEEYMQSVLEEVFKTSDLKVLTMEVKPGSKPGDNYACQIFRIPLTFIIEKEERHMSLIGKLKPDSKLVESMKEFDPLFFTVEAQFFTSLLPEFRKNINKNEDFAPECYYTDWEKNIIFMEDLVAKQFELVPRRVFLSKEECFLTIEALATLHGASYHTLEKNPGLKKTYQKGFWSSEKNEPMEKFFRHAQNSLEKFVGTYGLSEQVSKKLVRCLDQLNVEWCKVCDLQEDRLNFLLHGDSWKNNMMFYYKDGVVDAVKLLDFQVINYNSFANDLQYFLFSSASSDVLLNDLDYLLEAYYHKLRSVAPEIPGLTLERVRREFAERYYFGFLMTVAFRAIIAAAEPLDMEDMLAEKIITDTGFNDPQFIADLKKLLPFFEKVGVF